jgi:predicted ATP-dependent protease
MSLENVIYKLQRALDKKIESLAISVTSGGVDSMETYKYIIGQINALEATKQEISTLLNQKEQNEGTVVDINTKNSLTK